MQQEQYKTKATTPDDSAMLTLLIKREDALINEKRPYEPVWDEVNEYVLPSRGKYSYKEAKYDPERKSRKRFDSTPVNAARQLAAKIIAEMTGSSVRWFEYRAQNPVMDSMDSVRRFLQDLSDRAYTILNESSFRLAHVEATTDWIAYGTACLFVQRQKDDIIFKSIPIQELCIAENKKGEIDTVIRSFKMTIRQAAQMWGEEALPDSCRAKLEDRPDEEITISHCVMPNGEYKKGSMLSKQFRFSSVYYIKKDKKILHKGGVKRMPYIVFRFWKRSGEVYGGSPAIDALADIRLLNMMEEVSIRVAQLEAAPPMIMGHDSVVMPLRVVPNGINFGGFTPDGKRMIDRLIPQSSNVQYLENSKEQKRMAIRSAFFVDPLINRENSIRTAAEVAKRSNEEMVGAVPFMSRFEVEYLKQVLDALLEDMLENDPTIVVPREMEMVIPTIEYTAPLAKTQRAQELNNSLQFLQVVQSMAQADPTVLRNLDMNATFRNLADLMSVPMKTIVPSEVVEAQKQQEQQMQQMAMLQQGMQAAGDQMQGMAKAGLINREDLGLPPAQV